MMTATGFQAPDPIRAGLHYFRRCPAHLVPRGSDPADRVEQECPRPAGGIEHALGQRRVDRAPDDFRRQPVGCVIFAEIMALRRVDEALIQRLQHIHGDILQPKPRRLPCNAENKACAVGVLQDTVKEVALDSAVDPGIGERAARHDGAGIGRRQIQHPHGNRLRYNGQIGVLQEQRIIADRGTINQAQQPVPQLALQRDLAVCRVPLPKRGQHSACPPERQAVAAEFALNNQGVRLQVVAIRQRGFEPGQQAIGVVRLGLVLTDFFQPARTQLIGDESCAIGGDAEILAPGLALPLEQIIRQPVQDVGQFVAKVALELEHGRAKQHIRPPVNFVHSDFVIDGEIICVESVAKDFCHVCSDLLVARTPGEGVHDVREMGTAPGDRHARKMRMRNAVPQAFACRERTR